VPLPTARRHALVLAAVALVAGGAYLAFRDALRVRWLVNRGADPAAGAAEMEAMRALRAMGLPAKPRLLEELRAPGGRRSTKAWVAAVLLRTPFFAKEEVRACLASTEPTTRRAAAFALLGGEESGPGFEETIGAVLTEKSEGRTPSPRFEAEDVEACIPVLVEWVGDREDLDSRHAARLLSHAPLGDARATEALLKVVEEVPSILGPGAPPGASLRKLAVVSALQSLVRHAARDESIVRRVSAVLRWIHENGAGERGADITGYILRMFEVTEGRGLDEGLLELLARDPNTLVRQRLASALNDAKILGPGALRALRVLVADESCLVRRPAIRGLFERNDPWVIDNLRYLVEDSYVFIRSDAIRFAGELVGHFPNKVRALVPLFVSCIEEPWGGAVGSNFVRVADPGRVEVVEAAALSLFRATGESHGFSELAMTYDWKKRAALAKRIVDDAAHRAEVVAEWRKIVPAEPAEVRVPHLVRRLLEDRDPENVLRAMRELKRITGRADTFPPEALVTGGDDTAARDAVRLWIERGDRDRAAAAWWK
jgi:hypothetical protein